MRLQCDVCGVEVTREPPWFLGCDAPTGPHFTCAKSPIGTWRKVEPPPAPAPVERKPRMSDADRAAAGWVKRWCLWHARLGWNTYGKPDDKRRAVVDSEYGANRQAFRHDIDEGWRARSYWWRRKRKPAAAPPRELCGAVDPKSYVGVTCDRPPGHVGAHSWVATDDRLRGERDDLRERLRVAEDALRLARADNETNAERANALGAASTHRQGIIYELSGKLADSESVREYQRDMIEKVGAELDSLRTKLAAAEAERDRLRADLASAHAGSRTDRINLARQERERIAKQITHWARREDNRLDVDVAADAIRRGAQWADAGLFDPLASEPSPKDNTTVTIQHPANVMAAEAIAREAAPLQVGDRVLVTFTSKVTDTVMGGARIVVKSPGGGALWEFAETFISRLPEPPK